MIVDEKGDFREHNFSKAIKIVMGDPMKTPKGRGGKKLKQSSAVNLNKILRNIIVKNAMTPVIVFSFSKKEVEAFAVGQSNMDLNDINDKDAVEEIFKNAIESLAEEDRELPQIQEILPILKKGIGVHHGGLLPIIKEVVEILFQEGLIKVLFSTETFSMGVNMPAR